MKYVTADEINVQASPGTLLMAFPSYFSNRKAEIATLSPFLSELFNHFMGEIHAFAEVISVVKAFLLQLGKFVGSAFAMLEPFCTRLKKAITKEKVLDEIKQSYSAQTTSELTQEYLALGIGEAVKLVGVFLGPILWIMLKLCPVKHRRQILAFLSPFRSGLKSVALLQKTGAMTGVHALQSPVATAAAGVLGGIVGLSLTSFIADEIKKTEDSFDQRIKLNQLLKNHLATSADSRIPMGLSDAMLIVWLENPHYSADLNLAPITKANFRDITEEALKRYYWFKLFAEIINGTYSVSVLNSDVGHTVQLIASIINFMTGVANLMINYAMATLNAVLLSVSLYNYNKIAQHKVDEFKLKIRQSYLQANTELTKKTYEASETFRPTSDKQPEENADDVNVLSPSFVRSKEYDAWVEAKCEQRRCEEQLANHQKNAPINAHLTTAAVRGFNEGSGAVAFYMGVPISALVAAHLIALACWPVFLAFALTTIAVGSYCAYQNYQETKQKFNVGDSEEATATKKLEEIELKNFSASSEPDKLDKTEDSGANLSENVLDPADKLQDDGGFVVRRTEKVSGFGSFFGSKPNIKPSKIQKEEIELDAYSCCAAAAA